MYQYSRVHATYLCRIAMSGKVSDLPIRYKRAVFTQKTLDRINFRSGNGGRVLRITPGDTLTLNSTVRRPSPCGKAGGDA